MRSTLLVRLSLTHLEVFLVGLNLRILLVEASLIQQLRQTEMLYHLESLVSLGQLSLYRASLNLMKASTQLG